MTTRERAYARHTNRQAAHYTEVWIVGTPDETTALVNAMRHCGRLVYASAPSFAGPDDHRHRRYLKLRHHQ
jgi:hypothetical protein